MILYPAIDLLDGRVVRLLKGEFNAVTDYGADPAAVAEEFKADGSPWVHVVDLAGARDGERRQTPAIKAVSDTGIKVQSGGGIRGRRDIDALLAAGVERLVVGSVAISDPDTVQTWMSEYGAERFNLAFDVRYLNGAYRPAIKGWTDVLTVTLDDVIQAYDQSAIIHAMATDIGRDGDLSGPNVELYADLVRRYSDIQWQASGGISALDDFAILRRAGVAGAISGRALYEGEFTLKEALACLQDA
ncbi:MAG: 1-(5-phosphoribosyl)-5-((5-phosphoribosylamino)methylideneamino)imidazole-4-carboxamide isomerase [Alphaproteobacteria bacterium]|nr:1-(5-phosphoribosyl)-5-((5-phosphoribosylamino)methylideneamino)imidazole-4-carboxamide isomerase [Alphaproteobacteria bacterium]